MTKFGTAVAFVICILRFIFSYNIMPKYMVNKLFYDLVVVLAHFQKKNGVKDNATDKKLKLGNQY